MLHKIKYILTEIFLETTPFSKNEEELFCPQDLTEHYRQEIPDMAMDEVFVATHYHDIEGKIEAYKYRSDRQYSIFLVDLLSKLLDKYSSRIEGEDLVLVGIPMHWSRYALRGFNHIDKLVEGLAKQEKYRVIAPLSAKISRRQSHLSKAKRKQNRECAYSLKKDIALPKNIILIDDVISTGSTANACARILKDAGVEKVYGVFLASNQ